MQQLAMSSVIMALLLWVTSPLRWQVDGSNENGFGEQHPSLATVRGLLANEAGRRLVIHNGDISYARHACIPLL
jgi:hypothetical protein